LKPTNQTASGNLAHQLWQIGISDVGEISFLVDQTTILIPAYIFEKPF